MAEIEFVEDVDLGGGWEGEIKRAIYRGGNETYLAILYASYGGPAPGSAPDAPQERGYRVLEGEYFTTRQGERTVITGPRRRVTFEGGTVREERL